MKPLLVSLGFVPQLFADESLGIAKGVQFPIIRAPEPSALLTLALYLAALVAFVAIVRRKRSPAGR